MTYKCIYITTYPSDRKKTTAIARDIMEIAHPIYDTIFIASSSSCDIKVVFCVIWKDN